MTDSQANAFTYVCSLIEYIARKTTNRRGTIVGALGTEGLKRLLDDALLNKDYLFLDSLGKDDAQQLRQYPFAQEAARIIEAYAICDGDFDTITNCKYPIPYFHHIGRLYCIMIEDCARQGEEIDEMMHIFTSFISDEISKFKTGVYMENPDYLEWSYREGFLLD